MTSAHSVRSDRILMGSLPCGSDLLGEIIDTCVKEEIRLGRVEAIGSVTRARLGFFHQEAREYRHFTLNEPLELVALKGNIAVKDGSPFVHAHAVFAGMQGRTWGGHLASGTDVYACEYVLEVFSGPALTRKYDPRTGLSLWKTQTGD